MRSTTALLAPVLCSLLLCTFEVGAQGGTQPGNRPGTQRAATPGTQYAFLRKTKLVARFDQDKDGRLNRAERTAAREYLRTHPDAQRRRQFERRLSGAPNPSANKGPTGIEIRPESVAPVQDAPLYAPLVLRTLFLTFPESDWMAELKDFYKTDVEIPATLRVDGRDYLGVGVRVRGSSSFLMVGNSPKKSFNLSLDHTDGKQRLLGFRTLNLLNGNQDPTFLREVLFSHIASRYLPTPRVNFVRLVINGENWGVYQNAQQFNRDFVKDWFGDRRGHRWKILRNQGGLGALRYLGEDRARYEAAYELRGKADPAAWQRLIAFCKVLQDTPAAELPTALPKVLDVHGALWFCALESVLLPNDGYLNQGYDYRLFEAPDGRFHVIPHDKNEILPQLERTFTRGGRTTLGLDASPLRGSDDPARPLFSRLLEVPAWRARYLAHVRHLTTHWLDWKVLGPVCRSYLDLIRDEVARDDKKLFTRRTFDNAVELQEGVRMRRSRRPLRWIVAERQKRVLADPDIAGPWPEIRGVRCEAGGGGTRVRVAVAAPESGDVVVLHHRSGAAGAFVRLRLTGTGGEFVGTVPGKAKSLQHYVELRRGERVVFEPPAADAGPARVR